MLKSTSKSRYILMTSRVLSITRLLKNNNLSNIHNSHNIPTGCRNP